MQRLKPNNLYISNTTFNKNNRDVTMQRLYGETKQK